MQGTDDSAQTKERADKSAEQEVVADNSAELEMWADDSVEPQGVQSTDDSAEQESFKARFFLSWFFFELSLNFLPPMAELNDNKACHGFIHTLAL